MEPKANELWKDSFGHIIFIFIHHKDKRLHCIFGDGSGSMDDYPEDFTDWTKIYPI